MAPLFRWQGAHPLTSATRGLPTALMCMGCGDRGAQGPSEGGLKLERRQGQR